MACPSQVESTRDESPGMTQYCWVLQVIDCNFEKALVFSNRYV